MTQIAKRILSASAGLSFALIPFFSMAQGQAQGVDISVPETALSKADAKAKLDSKLVGAPAMPQPTLQKGGRTLVNNREIGFNLKTKTAQTKILPRVQRSLAQAFAPGSSGIKPDLKLEPRSGRSVIGADNRTLITSTTSFPWRAMTKLYMTFPNGKVYSCSGGLIAAKYVLTAGHCVHSSSDGGWATKVEVIPGLSGSYKPYGSAYATYMRSYTGWTGSRDANYDFALVTLDRTIGNSTGWFGYGYFPTINGVTGNLGGYPGDKGGVNLYYHYGAVASSTSQRVSYQIDTAPGQSGSSVYRFYTPPGGVSGRYVFAVHTNGTFDTVSGYNSGTRIDSAKYSNLQSWIGSGF